MKKFILFFALLIASMTFCINIQAASIYTTNEALTVKSLRKESSRPSTALTNVKKESFWQRLSHPFERTDDKDLVFYLLCIFVGTLGIHRLIMGSKPIMILWYILATIAGFLLATLLATLSFGFLGFLGWIIILALPLSDLIAAFLNGTSYFQGNDDIFAGFKGLRGGSKK